MREKKVVEVGARQSGAPGEDRHGSEQLTKKCRAGPDQCCCRQARVPTNEIMRWAGVEQNDRVLLGWGPIYRIRFESPPPWQQLMHS